MTKYIFSDGLWQQFNLLIERYQRPISFTPLPDGRNWVLRTGLVYPTEVVTRWSRGGQEALLIVVPPNFTTDFASVPRLLWWLFPPHGRYTNAAVVHDFLYKTQPDGITRLEADKIMLEAMERLRVLRTARYLIFAGVRIGGWYPWWKQKQLRNHGETWICEKLPMPWEAGPKRGLDRIFARWCRRAMAGMFA